MSSSEPSVLLPTEIWHRISSLLSKSDVINLSESSTYFLCMIRPLFYRKINLFQNHQVITTLSLLGRDKELAGVVSELSLRANQPIAKQRRCLINLNAMKNMTGMKTLTLLGDILWNSDGDETTQLFEILHEMRDLKEFNVDLAWKPDDIPLSENQLGKIQKLEVIRWTCHGPRSEILLHSLLSGSLDSLHTLHISLSTFDETTQALLFSLRFPRLESLTLRDVSEGDPLGEPFIRFIIGHDTLTHLDLNYLMGRTSSLRFNDDILDAFKANPSTILPRLKSFRGDATSVGVMARAGLSCLSTSLVKLELGPSGNGHSEIEMLREVLGICGLDDITQLGHSRGRFGVLKDFGLQLKDFSGSGVSMFVFTYLASFISAAASVSDDPFPKSPIEVWRLPFPYVNCPADVRTPEEVAHTFRVLRNLKVLHLDWRFVGEEDFESEVWMEQFVKKCGEKVERVYFCRYPDGDVVESWGIERGRMEENGPVKSKPKIWLEFQNHD
ncbi:hypothetical protein E1B28_006445 [Marasmius oreades]|uniref:F-box domain-containing protein n=1 Tax=Marasmius oreades TaxID=181124 RepID=A0A9P7UVS1_9AGAR|nr:uncharacterized protein E1B28_006445 [Marasmius oreades]KAG7095735.1 hypothetical protein E1B28_006445 [Marasmius oreades]